MVHTNWILMIASGRVYIFVHPICSNLICPSDLCSVQQIPCIPSRHKKKIPSTLRSCEQLQKDQLLCPCFPILQASVSCEYLVNSNTTNHLFMSLSEWHMTEGFCKDSPPGVKSLLMWIGSLNKQHLSLAYLLLLFVCICL